MALQGAGCWVLWLALWLALWAKLCQCEAVEAVQGEPWQEEEEEQRVLVQVWVQQELSNSPVMLQGELLGQEVRSPQHPTNTLQELEADLRLTSYIQIKEDREETRSDEEDTKPWIGVVPVQMQEGTNQESFASTVVNRVKRALVLGASALIILVLNQNSIREMDLSEVLSKPIIIIQNTENVTKLFSALLRGLHATARITYRTFLQNNMGATLTLWSSCGRSRWGRFGEWQGVVCTGETNSPVQKYLQQLWNTVVLVALILCTGVIVQARWQYQDQQLNDHLQLPPKQDVLNKLSVLQTRRYRTQAHPDTCAVCLEQYTHNQCLRVLPCLHEFHRDCVDPWLLLQQTCPLCKRSVLGHLC